jgi:succinate dehydrogenase flavin-adding protein (antitoxin of CptAB toxin-antitoxin module)
VSTKQFREGGDDYESWTAVKLKNAKKAQKEILEILDSQLLAWITGETLGEIDDEAITNWINRTLFSTQTVDIPKELNKMKDGLKNRSIAVYKLLDKDEERKSFNKTGLSITGNRTA